MKQALQFDIEPVMVRSLVSPGKSLPLFSQILATMLEGLPSGYHVKSTNQHGLL